MAMGQQGLEGSRVHAGCNGRAAGIVGEQGAGRQGSEGAGCREAGEQGA